MHNERGKRKENRKEERKGNNLEREIESDRRIVTNNTAAIASPQRENAFFPNRTGYAIQQALESETPTRDNCQVALLGLQQ